MEIAIRESMDMPKEHRLLDNSDIVLTGTGQRRFGYNHYSIEKTVSANDFLALREEVLDYLGYDKDYIDKENLKLRQIHTWEDIKNTLNEGGLDSFQDCGFKWYSPCPFYGHRVIVHLESFKFDPRSGDDFTSIIQTLLRKALKSNPLHNLIECFVAG